MSLPDIPDEAWQAVAGICRGHNRRPLSPQSIRWNGKPTTATMADTRSPCYECAIERAWPHLYAAALRHAADRIQSDGTSDLYPQWSADALRDWADEATP